LNPAKAQRFGNYEILYEIKSGGMGAVLLGRRRGPGAFEQLVAIKTIRPEYASAANVRAMFLDEAAILARLNHPGIAHVHDFGEEGGTLYMVMEYVAGIPFRDLLELGAPPMVVARAIGEAARGLHAAHEVRDLAGNAMGLVHRDISPDNLLLGYDGHVKVIDFGIALIKNRQAPVTEFGTVKGKPPYMSPEQVKNEPMDRRSDVFSLAIVTWELLARSELFSGDSIYSIAYAVENKDIEPPSRARGEALPVGLDAAVMNALDRNLAQRTQTAAALAEELEAVATANGGEALAAWAERELGSQREKHRMWLAGIATGAHQLPKIVGRQSGQLTEIGDESQAPAKPRLVVSPVIPGEVDARGDTSIGAEPQGSEVGLPARRSLTPIVLVLVFALVVGGIAIYIATRKPNAVAHLDAGVHAAVVMDARAFVPLPPPDAPVVAIPVVVDAGVPVVLIPVDAGPRHPPHDAHHGQPPHDAGAPPPVDAILRPAGSGFVTIKYKPGPYANISIDGGGGIPGPIFHRKVSAGPHTIKFIDPETGEVLDTQTVDVSDGQTRDVTEH
jgi:eukaryotic-like serine/threonine-protein kinase